MSDKPLMLWPLCVKLSIKLSCRKMDRLKQGDASPERAVSMQLQLILGSPASCPTVDPDQWQSL